MSAWLDYHCTYTPTHEIIEKNKKMRKSIDIMASQYYFDAFKMTLK